MAKVFIEETTLTAIGDAIRSKTGKTELIDPAVMSTEIESISGGGLPPEAYVITGNCTNRFSKNYWNWYIEMFGPDCTTQNITGIARCFSESTELTTIPFDFNMADSYTIFDFSELFSSCWALTDLPRIKLPDNLTSFDFNSASGVCFVSIMGDCWNIRDAENLFDAEQLKDYISRIRLAGEYEFDVQQPLRGCRSLRKVPSWYYALNLSPESIQPMYWYVQYNSDFNQCFFLDEIIGLPVRGKSNANWGSDAINNYQGGYLENLFQQTFEYCYRLKNMTFETKPDGTPYEANWAMQRIDLQRVGWGYITNFYNSGITNAKEVYDADTYASLKNDPDWYTGSGSYSRYNHDSAVATINSLPDTTAFLAKVGGGNTILFSRTLGSNTDGGACGNLTEEEIAVAAAKGWTVSLA